MLAISAPVNSVKTIPSLHVFFCSLLLIGFISSSSVMAQSDPLIRINSGSLEGATGNGETYVGDLYYTDSSVIDPLNITVTGTLVPEVYQTERIANDNFDPFSYSIPVPQNGTYSLSLHFAETAFQSDGLRVFDVEVEGVTVLNDYDIHAQAGGMNAAVVENILSINVTDGALDIEFTSVIERAKINAIEVFGTATPVSIPFGINAGGDAYSSGVFSWMADDGSYFLEGMPFTKTVDVSGTNDDALYEAERFANLLRFVLPGMPAGEYTIDLSFAETFHSSSGQRLFDVTIEGETVLDDYDIFVASGGMNTAVIETFTEVLVDDGILNITLTSSMGSATINAIALTSVSLVSNEDPGAIERPESYQLTSAYPNPFNPQTQFTLTLGTTQHVDVDVYNVLGQPVVGLFNGILAGQQQHAFRLDAGELPSGIYLIQVRGEHFAETQQVILLK